jgi:hypothetical protein
VPENMKMMTTTLTRCRNEVEDPNNGETAPMRYKGVEGF